MKQKKSKSESEKRRDRKDIKTNKKKQCDEENRVVKKNEKRRGGGSGNKFSRMKFVSRKARISEKKKQSFSTIEKKVKDSESKTEITATPLDKNKIKGKTIPRKAIA